MPKVLFTSKSPFVVGFWNVQRTGNIHNVRTAYMMKVLVRWLKGIGVVKPPDVLILCEISQLGPVLATQIEKAVTGYKADFVPTYDVNNNIGPCNFLVIQRKGPKGALPYSIKPVGAASMKRPLVVLKPNKDGLPVLGGLHAKANRNKSEYDIISSCDELRREASFGRAALIGDMNFNYSDLMSSNDEDDDESVAGFITHHTKFRPYKTARKRTYSKSVSSTGAILDYMWALAVVPVPMKPIYPMAEYKDWDNIDHAPIAFALG
jgi:hypothetical protein